MPELAEDEVLKPDRIGLTDKEGLEVKSWRPLAPKQRQLKQRIFSLQQWIEGQHRFVEEEEVITKAMMSYKIDRQTAQRYLKIIVDQFKRVGVPVVDQS